MMLAVNCGITNQLPRPSLSPLFNRFCPSLSDSATARFWNTRGRLGGRRRQAVENASPADEGAPGNCHVSKCGSGGEEGVRGSDAKGQLGSNQTLDQTPSFCHIVLFTDASSFPPF